MLSYHAACSRESMGNTAVKRIIHKRITKVKAKDRLNFARKIIEYLGNPLKKGYVLEVPKG